MEEKNRYRNRFVQILIIFIYFAFIAKYIIGIAFVQGNSMEPTLKNGQIVVVLKIGYTVKPYDIVISKPTNETRFSLIKRVIAVSNQEVVIEKCDIIVDGKIIESSNNQGVVIDKLVVPEEHYFLLGDNVDYSFDSRHMGTFSKNDLIGKVIYIF